jgi:RNA polymerase sigma-70 factor (ECF subfamily)
VPLAVAADRRARFEAVFVQVYEPLQAYAHRRTDAATADDVVAETLLVLWRRLEEAPVDQIVPWAYGVARRCLANQRRGGQRRLALVDRLAGERSLPLVDGASNDERTGDDALLAALAELSADDREVIQLWAWEQLQPREIGAALGITANAASIRVYRAKQRLAAAMERKTAHRDGHTDVGHTQEAP